MKDEEKTKGQLISELNKARLRIAELETLELRLRESEERYRRLVELSPDMISIHCEGKIIFINKAGTKLLGAEKPEDFTGKNIMEFIHPDYREIVNERIKQTNQEVKAVPFVEEKFVRLDGTSIDVEVTAISLAFQGKPAVQVIARDITGRKQAEEEIKSERRRLFSLLDQLPAIVYLQAPDYSIRFSNRYFWDRFGKPKKRTCYEILRNRQEPCKDCPTFRVFDTKIPFEWEWTRFDGRTYQIYTYPFSDIDGFPLVLVLGIDITGRKRAEESLAESEERYRVLFNSGNDSVFVHGLTEQGLPGKFIEVNGIACKKLGYEKDELLALSPLDIREKREENDNVTGKLLTDKHVIFERVHLAKDGGKIPVEINSHLFELKGHPTILSIARDITERKTAEEKLRAAHQRLFDIIEFLPDATFVVDHNKRVIAWNRATEEMTGVRKEEIIGKGDYAYAVPFYGKPRPILIDLIFADDNELELKYENVERKGNTVFAESFTPYLYQGRGAYLRASASPLFDGDGNLTGAIQSIRDTTQRKQAAEALRLSEELFSKAFNASPSVMSILAFTNTYTDGIFVDVNNNFTRLTGYNRHEIIGRTVSQLSIWVDPGDLAKIIATVLKQKEVRNLEVSFCLKSGEIRIGLLSAAVIDFRGKPSVLVCVNDITERKQFEKEIARLDRLNLVGEMAAGIGHEIRNPMTTVRGFLQMLGRKEECARYKDYFKLMIEELDRANSIITEYLSLAKDKPINLEEKNINSIVEALYPLIQADALETDKHVKIELTKIPDLPLDEKEIRQLILNLVRNGLEAMSPGGSLTIKTFLEGKRVVLSVQDKGKGIQPDILEKIGTPFFTTKEQGTGMGLAVCYSIAARHNAAIKIKTNSRGTTFSIRFKFPQKQQQLWP